MTEDEKNILIISVRGDVHVEAVLKHFAPNVNIFLHNSDGLANLYQNECRFIIDYDSEQVKIVRADGMEIDLSQITAVWYRKPHLWYIDCGTLEKEIILDHRYKKQENLRVVDAIAAKCTALGKLVINDVDMSRKTSKKVEQLFVAKKLDLKIPSTLITSQVAELQRFIQKNNDDVVIKSIGGEAEYGKWLLPSVTHQYSQQELIKDYQGFSSTGYYFLIQQELKKKADIRVTVVGEKIFACKIYSQDNPKSITDFRIADPYSLKHESIKLSDDTAKKIINLCRHYGLIYAALDLVEDLNEQLFFLEINPLGQYLWIEDLTEMPISQHIADYLTRADAKTK